MIRHRVPAALPPREPPLQPSLDDIAKEKDEMARLTTSNLNERILAVIVALHGGITRQHLTHLFAEGNQALTDHDALADALADLEAEGRIELRDSGRFGLRYQATER